MPGKVEQLRDIRCSCARATSGRAETAAFSSLGMRELHDAERSPTVHARVRACAEAWWASRTPTTPWCRWNAIMQARLIIVEYRHRIKG